MGAVLAVIVAAVSCTAVYGYPAPIQARIDIRPDPHALDGTLHPGDGTPVNDGEYSVVLNQLPTLKAGSRDCNIEFENPVENHDSSRINLYLKSTGKRLGGTRLVDPGQYVEIIELNQELAPGEYPVTAKIELFTDKTPAGGMSLELTIRVIGQ